jgi:hypothetical protein
MELTGKCKEEFEKWVKTKNYSICHDVCERQMNIVPLGDMIEQLAESMQYGVYVDFFDSVGSYISVSGLVLSKTYICDISVISNVEHYYDGFSTRPEARTKAIEKANEIYNLKK